MSSKKTGKILIAAGGTGGHMFPAQALAEQLRQSSDRIEFLFAGAGLSTNRYFRRERFDYREIPSATPYKRSVFALLKSMLTLAHGVWKSLQLIKKERPAFIVGFGSFHSFPVLAAGVLSGVPIALFESNAIPGKVNRFFSRWAAFNAVQFLDAQKGLKGETVEVAMPIFAQVLEKRPTKEEARLYFSLEPQLFTLLIFGGSQGALALNQIASQAVARLKEANGAFQVIHLAGAKDNLSAIQQCYASLHIPAAVKAFEHQMSYAWGAADLVICRSGAATVAEELSFEVPGILVPYPAATDNHQQKNAEFMERTVEGAKCVLEKDLSVDRLFDELKQLMTGGELEKMRTAICRFKSRQKKRDLANILMQKIQE